MTNIEDYIAELERIARENNLELTENAYNIARFRARVGIPMDKCPCEQQATDRGCIGSKCWEEINQTGKCLCNCFRKRGVK